MGVNKAKKEWKCLLSWRPRLVDKWFAVRAVLRGSNSLNYQEGWQHAYFDKKQWGSAESFSVNTGAVWKVSSHVI